MSAQAHTYQRVIEDACVTLLTSDATVNQAYQDLRSQDYTPAIRRAYRKDLEVSPLDIIVHARDLTNAMLGATGRGAQWRVTLVVMVIVSIDHDKANDNADRVQGAVERWLASLTAASLNTALGVGASVRIDGITGAEQPDDMDGNRESLARSSAVTLHFSVV